MTSTHSCYTVFVFFLQASYKTVRTSVKISQLYDLIFFFFHFSLFIVWLQFRTIPLKILSSQILHQYLKVYFILCAHPSVEFFHLGLFFFSSLISLLHFPEQYYTNAWAKLHDVKAGYSAEQLEISEGEKQLSHELTRSQKSIPRMIDVPTSLI